MIAQVTAPAERTVFSFHCPPYRTGLDDAPELTADMMLKDAGRAVKPVGSTAVREAIEEHQPALSLHGHIHEARGNCRIGRTLCINPGQLRTSRATCSARSSISTARRRSSGSCSQADSPAIGGNCMATIAGEAPYEERSLFVRKATGLVRGWSVQDAFIYATFSINLITLGLYIFADAPFIPKGSLILAIVLSGAYLVFQTIVYAALIAVMPRAGGDYVWVSRVIGGGIGFVLAVCGWWFINWHWVPIYANILAKEFFQPLGAIVGWTRLRLVLERAERDLHRRR